MKYKNALILGLVFLGLCLFFGAVHTILLPFVLALILAYFLNPITTRFQKYLGRSGATAVSVGGFFLGIIAFFVLLIPILQTQLTKFSIKIPLYIRQVWGKVEGGLQFLKETLPPEQFQQQLYKLSYNVSSLMDNIAGMVLRLVSGSFAFFTVVSLLFIVPIVVFYLLIDWDKLVDMLQNLIPRRYKKQTTSLFQELNQTLAGFVRGQVTVCLVLGLLYATALAFTGLDLGVLVGLLIGLFSFIPYVGFLFGVFLSIILLCLQGAGWVTWISVATVFIVCQIIDACCITPRFLGKNTGLHPVWVMFALLAGGALAGFLGVLLAVPTACVIKVILHRVFLAYQKSSVYTKDD